MRRIIRNGLEDLGRRVEAIEAKLGIDLKVKEDHYPEPIREHRVRTQELLIEYGDSGTWGMNMDAWKIPPIKKRLEEDGIVFEESQ